MYTCNTGSVACTHAHLHTLFFSCSLSFPGILTMQAYTVRAKKDRDMASDRDGNLRARAHACMCERAHTYTRKHKKSPHTLHTHTHTLSVSLSLSHTHTHTLSQHQMVWLEGGRQRGARGVKNQHFSVSLTNFQPLVRSCIGLQFGICDVCVSVIYFCSCSLRVSVICAS